MSYKDDFFAPYKRLNDAAWKLPYRSPQWRAAVDASYEERSRLEGEWAALTAKILKWADNGVSAHALTQILKLPRISVTRGLITIARNERDSKAARFAATPEDFQHELRRENRRNDFYAS